MNTEQLRQSVREKWLSYYEDNREWLSRLGVWVNCEGERRPSSGFILATLSVLEPRLTQLLPLIVDLSSNPDRIMVALGLNFNPEDYLMEQGSTDKALSKDRETSNKIGEGQIKMLPSFNNTEVKLPSAKEVVRVHSRQDEYCQGSRPDQREKD
ncbi:DUF5331 domain-containing protein [Leptothermofonsia sp. ETS-13]|uniref:DUF5331 domain-containing protein n=1 Tax=Leptothermofonsia sp. ETS-13 TaxID=3035696 RepID=UPI003B9FFFC8